MRTLLAKAVFWVGYQLMRIKTPHLTHRLIWTSPDKAPQPGDPKWAWEPCHTSSRLMDLAEWIDPQHFDHWAFDHDDCPVEPCMSCGGDICGREEEIQAD